MKVERIVWEDHSYSREGWQDINDLEDPAPVEINTIGITIKENDEALTVIQSFAEDAYMNSITILKKCVLERETIAVSEDVGDVYVGYNLGDIEGRAKRNGDTTQSC